MPELQNFIDEQGLWLFPKFQHDMKNVLQKAMPEWDFSGWKSEYKGPTSPRRSLFEVYPHDTSAPGIVGFQIMEDSIRVEARDSPVGSPQMKTVDPETSLDEVAKELKTMLNYDKKMANRKLAALQMTGYLKNLFAFEKAMSSDHTSLMDAIHELSKELQMPVGPENKSKVTRLLNRVIAFTSPIAYEDLAAMTKEQLAMLQHHFDVNPVESSMERNSAKVLTWNYPRPIVSMGDADQISAKCSSGVYTISDLGTSVNLHYKARGKTFEHLGTFHTIEKAKEVAEQHHQSKPAGRSDWEYQHMTGSKNASFMEPQIWEGDFYLIDGNEGTVAIEADLIGELSKPLEEFTKEELQETFGEYYIGQKILNVDFEHGWGAMLSAPGYMDQTDLVVFNSEEEAKEYLMETYDLNENLEEIEEI